MMLIEQTTVSGAALPVTEFKNHLRLGTGFADDGVQDAVLESLLRTAMAAIEARTGKVMIERDFLWQLTAWRKLDQQALPVAPVSAIFSLKTLDRIATEELIDPARYVLQRDDHRPRLMATAACLPTIPVGGTAEVVFTAGFGPDWSDMPSDLGHAVLMLAAHYYEHRHETAMSEPSMPFGVTSLIEPYRTVRILGGGV